MSRNRISLIELLWVRARQSHVWPSICCLWLTYLQFKGLVSRERQTQYRFTPLVILSFGPALSLMGSNCSRWVGDWAACVFCIPHFWSFSWGSNWRDYWIMTQRGEPWSPQSILPEGDRGFWNICRRNGIFPAGSSCKFGCFSCWSKNNIIKRMLSQYWQLSNIFRLFGFSANFVADSILWPYREWGDWRKVEALSSLLIGWLLLMPFSSLSVQLLVLCFPCFLDFYWFFYYFSCLIRCKHLGC